MADYWSAVVYGNYLFAISIKKITQPIESITVMQLNDIKTFISWHGQIKTDYIKLIFIYPYDIVLSRHFMSVFIRLSPGTHLLPPTFSLVAYGTSLGAFSSSPFPLYPHPKRFPELDNAKIHTPSEYRGKTLVTTYIWIHQCCRKNIWKDVRPKIASSLFWKYK